MFRTILIIALLTTGAIGSIATAGTFNQLPYLADNQVDVLSRQVANQIVERDLFSAPYATVIVGNVDVYDHFPYLEAHYFQVVSDPGWNRLVFGEIEQGLQAFDGRDTAFGALQNPRGLATDDQGRVFVSDTDNDRVLVLQTVTEFDRMTLVPLFAIDNLNQPHDVAFYDGGTPFSPGDDGLVVANTGRNEIRYYNLGAESAVLVASLGGLGSATGEFAGPMAVTVGRADGANTTDVYVADAHNERVVHLRATEGGLQWLGEQKHDLGVVTSLSSDHWGNVYLASPAGGMAKYTAGMKTVVGTLPATNRARGFHVPNVTLTDHRNNSRRRSSEGRGVLVEEWDTGSGLRVMGLGVEVKNAVLAADGSTAVDVLLTDHATVTVSLKDVSSGEIVSSHRTGILAAGPQRVALRESETAAGWHAGSYELTVRAESTYDDDRASETTLTVVLNAAGNPDLPRNLKIVGNAPNPFNPATTISFLVPAGADETYTLNIYDTRGRLVRRLDRAAATPGRHQVVWDGRGDNGDPAGSGVYLYRVVVGDQKSAGKMTLLK